MEGPTFADGNKEDAQALLHGRSPHLLALTSVVMVWLGAIWPADVVVLVVHVVLRLTVLRLGIDIAIVCRARRRESLLRG